MFATMKQARSILNALLAATLAFAPVTLGSTMAFAQDVSQTDEVEELLRELAQPEQDGWVRIERQILRLWSRSGSATIDYLFGRGQSALRAGQAEDAIAHFSAVIDHDPDFAEAWNGRATAYFMANRLGQALADIEQVLIRNPRHFGALAGLGMILEQLDRPEEARQAYAASLAINPHQASVLASQARLDLATAGAAL